METKKPWEMPTPPPEVQTIIDKVDSNKELTKAECEKLDKWEDSQGGFGGIPLASEG